jgi:hypothetical protein
MSAIPPFELINGYTKEKLKNLILTKNIGEPALAPPMDMENEDGFMVKEAPGYCVYFNPENNNRCAIGCCIPDSFIEEHKAKLQEELSVDGLLKDFPELVEHMPFDLRGCGAFQLAHDQWEIVNSGLSLHAYLCKWIDENTIERG